MEGIDPRASMGAVRLTVADLEGARAFYERAVGLHLLERGGDLVRLGADPGRPLIELVGRPDAPPLPRRATGLFHLALLVPSRPDLARALRRVVAAGWGLTGASDHLVSEALYLDDPEGNGIEIYRDRPRESWERREGQIAMATLPLDLGGLIADLPGGGDEAMASGTRMGHVHLQVDDLGPAERFWSGAVGLDVTVRGYPGALFVSAGGYHHHLGLNTWRSAGAPAPPPGARGLERFELLLPDEAALNRLAARLEGAGVAVAPDAEGGLASADPAGNRVRLALAPA